MATTFLYIYACSFIYKFYISFQGLQTLNERLLALLQE